MKDEVLKENNMNNKNEKENAIMENKNNVNAGYVDIRLGLSTKKMLDYRCEENAYYEFPHYLIHSENHHIQCDSDTLIDITAITSYNEKVTVLIKRSDLNVPGFKLFINDRLAAGLNCINKMKIRNSEDIERYACYRELRTLVDFINKYKINCMVKDSEISLVHTIDERYKHFAIVEFYGDGSECNYASFLYDTGDDELYNNVNNGNHKEEIDKRNGVRYVNTTHKTFTNIMYGSCNDFPKLNLSTRKVTEYKCDLSPAPDDASKDWGAIYLFPHYLIESPKYRIEPDIQDTDLVDITDICSYDELFTVLIDKNDMTCPGFRRFILDTLDNMLNTVNKCMIPTTIDPERYLSYRQLMTMIQFINKYNKYLNILPYRFKNVLVHILDDNNDECGYYRYNIATIAENGKVIGDIMKCHLVEKSEVGKTANYDYRNNSNN